MMEESEGVASLRRAAETHAKLAGLIEKKEKPKPKDVWDKFAVVSSFASSVVLAGVGIWFTHQGAQTASENNTAQATRDLAQKEQQNKISNAQVVVQAMPYLLANDDNKQKQIDAVRVLALLPDHTLINQLTSQNPTPENVQVLSNLYRSQKELPEKQVADHSKEAPVAREPTATPVVTSVGSSGHTILLDGFKNFGVSGFQFSEKKIVAWGTDPVDIEVANPDSSGSSNAVFFLETDLPPYTALNLKPGKLPASAGIIEMAGQTYEQIKEAPETGYVSHYFAPKLGASYCVRTFDGAHYAKIRVTDILNDRIGFDWQYLPSGRIFR